ncbi:MAG: AI-2E family transporter [Phycisphaerales bacterium]
MSGQTGSPPPAPQDWRRLHLWQFQPVRDLMLIALLVLVVWVGYEVRLVTVPLLLALMMAYLFEPVVRAVTKRGWFSRGGAALGIIGLVLVLVLVPLALGVGFAAVQGVSFAGNLSRDIRSVLVSVEAPDDTGLRDQIRGGAWRDIRDWMVENTRKKVSEPGGAGGGRAEPEKKGDAAGAERRVVGAGEPEQSARDVAEGESAEGDRIMLDVEHMDSTPQTLIRTVMAWTEQNAAGIASTLGKRAVGGGAQALAVVVSTLSSIGAFVFALCLTMFFFYFASTGWGRVLSWAEGFIPHAGKYRWMRMIKRMDRAIAGFVRGRLTIATIIGVFMTGAFWFIGAPAPLLLGPIVGVLYIVPYAAALAVPVVMLLMWLQSGATGFRAEWWWIVFAPIGCHACGQVLDDYILTPRIQGDNTDLEMPTILFASLAGGVLAGVYGLLLAIPVAACLKILANELLWPRVEKWVKGELRDPLPMGARE